MILCRNSRSCSANGKTYGDIKKPLSNWQTFPEFCKTSETKVNKVWSDLNSPQAHGSTGAMKYRAGNAGACLLTYWWATCVTHKLPGLYVSDGEEQRLNQCLF